MKMILTSLFMFAAITVFAQDTTKVEQYCELVAQGRFLSNKVTIDVNFGEERKFFSGDKRMRDKVSGKIKKFNSVTDALNYMGLQGWSLVNAFPMTEGSGPQTFHFYFRKLFNKDEIMKENNDN
jgi:hypothetical protein